MEFIYFLIAAFFSEIVAVIAGFGAATLLTPAATFFLPIKEVILLVAVFHLIGAMTQTVIFRREINWHIAALFGIPALMLTVVGAGLSSTLPADLIKIVLGWFLVTWAGVSFFDERIQLPKHPAALAGAGAGSGFIAGLIGTGGSIRASALTSFGLTRESYIATSAIIASLVDITRIPIYLALGAAKIDAPTIFSLLAVAVVATLIGRRIVSKIPATTFRKIVIAAVLLAGLKFILG